MRGATHDLLMVGLVLAFPTSCWFYLVCSLLDSSLHGALNFLLVAARAVKMVNLFNLLAGTRKTGS
jgi:hypothetical protein